MTQHLFIVTSAINTKFGTFSKEERLAQTIDTLKCIYSKIPDAKIAILESSGIPIEQEIVDTLHEYAHWVVNMTNDPILHNIQNNTDNWDIVKNMSELVSFRSGLQMLEDSNVFDGIDRVHKISGRYLLNDDFDVAFYDTVPDKIVLTYKYTTQFADMEVPYQYMARLWSWPANMGPEIKEFFTKAITEFTKRLDNGKYIDLEHLMYYFLPPEHIKEVPAIGVVGQLGQNGVTVNN